MKTLSSASTARRDTALMPPALLTSKRIVVALALVLTALVFLVYWPTLQYQFILDDHRFTSDPRIQDSGHVWEYFTSYVWAQFTGGPPSFYRPLFLLWMRINFLLSGVSPWGWHLLSIAKHVLVAALLGLLVYRLLRDWIAALLGASLFALHPAQTESVAWVTVPDALATLGILVSLLLYLRSLDPLAAKQNQGQEKRRKGKRADAYGSGDGWLFASAGAFFAALLAKETAIILPVVIFCLELAHSHNAPPKSKAERAGNPIGFLWTATGRTLPFLCAAGLYLLMRWNALSGKLSPSTQNLPLSNVLLSWPRILWFYLKVMFWPARSYSFADPILEQHFSVSGFVLPSIALACVLAFVAAALVWVRNRGRGRLSASAAEGVDEALTIGVLLVVLPLLLCLNLNALNPGDFLHGRYTYLPLAGLSILVAVAWFLSGRLRVPLLCAAGVVAAVLGTSTLSQERQWKDDLTVFTVAHQLAPHNAPVARNLANARVQAALLSLDEEGCGKAMPVFKQVAREYPDDWYAWGALAECFVEMNDLPQAETAMHRAADLSHDSRTIQQWQELRQHMGLPAGTVAQ